MLFGHTSSRDGCTMCGAHSTQPPLRNWRCIRFALLCVRVRKSNFWENSFTTFSSVPVSRVSIQVYFTQVKITKLFYMYFFILYFYFFLVSFYSFVCFAVVFFSDSLGRHGLPVSSLQCFGMKNFASDVASVDVLFIILYRLLWVVGRAYIQQFSFAKFINY